MRAAARGFPPPGPRVERHPCSRLADEPKLLQQMLCVFIELVWPHGESLTATPGGTLRIKLLCWPQGPVVGLAGPRPPPFLPRYCCEFTATQLPQWWPSYLPLLFRRRVQQIECMSAPSGICTKPQPVLGFDYLSFEWLQLEPTCSAAGRTVPTSMPRRSSKAAPPGPTTLTSKGRASCLTRGCRPRRLPSCCLSRPWTTTTFPPAGPASPSTKLQSNVHREVVLYAGCEGWVGVQAAHPHCGDTQTSKGRKSSVSDVA